jgi:hypothetical protein
LNRLPEVKRFLKEPGHADTYENLKVKFIRGKNPTLIIRADDGATIKEQIDLSPFKTTELHALLIEKGFVKKSNEAAGLTDILPVQSEKKHIPGSP